MPTELAISNLILPAMLFFDPKLDGNCRLTLPVPGLVHCSCCLRSSPLTYCKAQRFTVIAVADCLSAIRHAIPLHSHPVALVVEVHPKGGLSQIHGRGTIHLASATPMPPHQAPP